MNFKAWVTRCNHGTRTLQYFKTLCLSFDSRNNNSPKSRFRLFETSWISTWLVPCGLFALRSINIILREFLQKNMRTLTPVSVFQAQSIPAPPPSPRVQFNEPPPTVQLTQAQTSGYTMIPRARQTHPQSQPPSQAQTQSNEQHEHLQGAMPSRMGNSPTYTSVAHFTPGGHTGGFLNLSLLGQEKEKPVTIMFLT